MEFNWHDMYIGQKITSGFYIYPRDDGTKYTNFVPLIGNRRVITRFMLYLDNDNTITSIEEEKNYYPIEYNFNKSDINQAMDLLDEMLPRKAIHRIDSVLDILIEREYSENGWRFISHTIDNASLKNDDGSRSRVSVKKLCRALEYSYSVPAVFEDVALLRGLTELLDIKDPSIISLLFKYREFEQDIVIDELLENRKPKEPETPEYVGVFAKCGYATFLIHETDPQIIMDSINIHNDFNCVISQGYYYENRSGRLQLKKLSKLVDKWENGKLTIRDLISFHIKLKTGTMFFELIETEDDYESAKTEGRGLEIFKTDSVDQDHWC